MRSAIQRLLLVVLGATSCQSTSDPETESAAGGSSTGATTAVAASTSSSITTTAPTTDGPDRTTSADSTGMHFLPHPDGGGPHFECDIFSQDCPPGEKCTNWAFDGGLDWNGTKCVPVVDEPFGSGEPCHAVGSPTSGIDDCDSESMCFYLDPETLEGVCTPFCTGQESDPQCDEPDQFCHLQADGSLLLCLSRCNPLQQNCWAAGQGCYSVGNEWTCLRSAAGVYGDPCEFVGSCAPGLLCLDASTVPVGQACEGAPGCCSEICDLSDPAGDLQCAGAAGGQLCQPWYEAGTAPPGYENVGACALPA